MLDQILKLFGSQPTKPEYTADELRRLGLTTPGYIAPQSEGIMAGGYGSQGGGGAGGGLWQDLITPYEKPAPEPKWYEGLFGDDGSEASGPSGPQTIQLERSNMRLPAFQTPPAQQRRQRQMIERQLPASMKTLMGG